MLKMFLFLLLICACSSAVHLNTEPHSRIDAVKVETKTTPDNLEVPKKLYLDTEATELSQESGMTLAEAKALIKFRDRDVSSGSTITAISELCHVFMANKEAAEDSVNLEKRTANDMRRMCATISTENK